MNKDFCLTLFNSKHHDRSTFDCHDSVLNEYLDKYVSQDIKNNYTRMHVLVKKDELDKLIYGYFTVSSYSLTYGELTELLSKRKTKYQVIPAILIGRLAKNYNQIEITGGDILYAALYKSKAISKEIGAKFVVVECHNEKVKSFYLKHGFRELQVSKEKLIMSMATIPMQ